MFLKRKDRQEKEGKKREGEKEKKVVTTGEKLPTPAEPAFPL